MIHLKFNRVYLLDDWCTRHGLYHLRYMICIAQTRLYRVAQKVFHYQESSLNPEVGKILTF